MHMSPYTASGVCTCLHTLPVVCNAEGWIHLLSAPLFIVQSGVCLEAHFDCSKLNAAVYFVCVAEHDNLTGVATILTFPLPNVKSGFEPDEDDEEENPAINGDLSRISAGSCTKLLHILHTLLLLPGNKFNYYSLFIQFHNTKL